MFKNTPRKKMVSYRSAELLPLRRAGVAEVLIPICSLGKSGDRRHWDSPSCSPAAFQAERGGGEEGANNFVGCVKDV